MKKLIVTLLVILLIPSICFAGTAVGWENTTVTTSYTALLINRNYNCAEHMIYNPSGVSYYVAKDSNGTDEVEISGDNISFSLGRCCPSPNTKRLFYVKSSSGTITLTVFSNIKN